MKDRRYFTRGTSNSKTKLPNSQCLCSAPRLIPGTRFSRCHEELGRLIETAGELFEVYTRPDTRGVGVPFPKLVNEPLESNVSLDGHPLNEPRLHHANHLLFPSYRRVSAAPLLRYMLGFVAPFPASIPSRAICIFGVVNTSVAYRDRPAAYFRPRI